MRKKVAVCRITKANERRKAEEAERVEGLLEKHSGRFFRTRAGFDVGFLSWDRMTSSWTGIVYPFGRMREGCSFSWGRGGSMFAGYDSGFDIVERYVRGAK